MTTESYKGHRPGSPSGKLHKIFDKEGQEAAAKAAKKLGLEPHTARSLFSRWNNPTAKKSGKKAAKSNARKATGKSTAKSAKKAAPKKAAKKSSAPARERLATAAPAA